MITIHHLEQSRSQRIIWLAEELGIDYEVKMYKRDSKTMFAPTELQAIHPLGKSPVVTDGSTTVAESGAIIEYLIRTHGKGKGLRPDESSSSRTAYDFWLHFAEGSAMVPLLTSMYVAKYGTPEEAAKMKDEKARPTFQQHVNFTEGELKKSKFLAGNEFSAADIQMSFPLELLDVGGYIGKDQPHLSAWLSEVQGRPAYKRAIERGGPENYQLQKFKSFF